MRIADGGVDTDQLGGGAGGDPGGDGQYGGAGGDERDGDLHTAGAGDEPDVQLPARVSRGPGAGDGRETVHVDHGPGGGDAGDGGRAEPATAAVSVAGADGLRADP